MVLTLFLISVVLCRMGEMPSYGHPSNSKRFYGGFRSPYDTAVQNDTVYVDVFRDFGAVGDGKTDDTQAFQNALNFVGSVGGGIVVAPSPHVYKIEGTLSIPAQTTLQGSFQSVPCHATAFGGISPLDGGTTLLAYSGKGSTTGTSFITLTEDSVLKGLTIFYPEQVTSGVPTPYPWSIELSNCNNAAVIDVEILNSYMGIYMEGAARHFISKVYGQPLYRGIYLDSIYDIGRIENVHFNPWWNQEKTLIEWQKTNGVAFTFGRSDWEYVFNTFAWGYKIGYHFIETPTGSCNGNFLGIGADLMTDSAVKVEATQPMGLLITNSEFTAFEGNDSTQIRVTETNTGAVRLNNCNFWGTAIRNANLAGTGTVSFNSCVFVQWDPSHEAIYATNGNLQVTNSEFQQSGGTQIQATSGVSKAVVIGNIITGSSNMKIDAKVKEVGYNACDS